ncbi:MAG: NTP transferase domain-containing protein [Actinomycetaceae bacterium]|nr:NTP transferase domain-containing protein [Actinomycetaceae bacterium]
MSSVDTVIILAAGQGTRMKSATPKVLHEMCGRSLLGHTIAAARELGSTRIVVVVRHERDKVAAHALECDPDVIIADQDEIPGTGRAVWCALQALPEGTSGTCLVMAGDVPLLNAETLAGLADSRGDAALSVLTTILEDATGYGRIVRDETGAVQAIVEHKDASDAQREIREVNTSTYAFDIDFLRSALENVDTNNSQGEMYLTDVLEAAYKQGAGTQAMVLDDNWLVEGCNDLVQLAALRKEMNRRACEKLMRAGVSIHDPATTSVDVTVTAEPDAHIYPGAILRGATHIGARALVGPGEYTDATIGADADVRHCVVRGASVGAGEKLKPYTVL